MLCGCSAAPDVLMCCAQALKAYEEALSYSPANKVAKSRVDNLRTKVRNLNVSS